jgi:Ca2+-binding RTX toxin-like protein
MSFRFFQKPPKEVQPQVSFDGTDGGDLIQVTKNTVTDHPYFGNDDFLTVDANGGNDTIVRDRTGYYWGYGERNGFGVIDGGSGTDLLTYAAANAGIVADLRPGVLLDGTFNGYGVVHQGDASFLDDNGAKRGPDYVINVENLFGTIHGDTIHGHDGVNHLFGHDGDDEIHGHGGGDQILGGGGADDLFGGNGNDRIEGGDGDDDIHGGTGNDTLYGDDGDDTILGVDGADVIYGGDGNDTVLGGSGADVIHGGDGSNELHGDSGTDTFHISGFGSNDVFGGTGTDKVSYTQSVVVNLTAEMAWRGPEGVDGIDTLDSVENVTTGKHADAVIGSDVANTFVLGAGNDFAMGLGGDDKLYGGDGDDTLAGGTGEDRVDGGDGADTLYGEQGEDFIVGGKGGDRIRGGAGDDTIHLGNIAGSDTSGDVLIWDEGDGGTDTVYDFSLAHDQFHFRPGFLAAGPLDVNVVAFDFAGTGDALLYANVAGQGYLHLATLKNVSADALNDAIDDGSIFDTEVGVLGDGVPDGLFDDVPPGAEPPTGFYDLLLM